MPNTISPALLQARKEYHILAETFIKKLDEEGQEALGAYSGDEVGYLVNSYLRGGNMSQEDMKTAQKWISEIDKALTKAVRLEKPMVIYRGYGTDSARFNINSTFKDTCYISATIDRESALRFAKRAEGRIKICAEIILRERAPVAPLYKLAGYQGEEELLLPRGSRLDVIGVTSNAEGIICPKLRWRDTLV